MRRFLIAAMAAAIASPAFADPGAWRVHDNVSTLDGTRTYTASVASDGEVGNIINQTEKAHFVVMCARDGFSLMLDWPDFIDSDPSQYGAPVVMKVDDGAVQTVNWFGGGDGSQAVVLSDRSGKAMLAKLSAGKVLIVRVPDKHGGQEATFQIAGLDQIAAIVGPMQCGPPGILP